MSDLLIPAVPGTGPTPHRHGGRAGGASRTSVPAVVVTALAFVGAVGFIGIHAASTPSAPTASAASGNVAEWIAQAQQVLVANGTPVSELDANTINLIIQGESGGNPRAINNYDSNAAAGHPSKGLMQCIDSTFAAHSLPGHRDIWNPVDSIIAGVRYALARYGSLSAVPGVAAVARGDAYIGY